MIKKLLFLFLLLSWCSSPAQEDLGLLLASGIEDTRTFASQYVRPGVEGILYNRSSGWYQTAKVKRFLGFEFSVVGNASVNLEEHHTFFLDVGDYQNLRFGDGSAGRRVATILGHVDPPVEVLVDYENASGRRETALVFPQGLGSSGIDVIPTFFLQARLGIFKGTEIKARYFPTRSFGDVHIDLYGGAVQHEFTSWLPDPDVFPVAVSGLVAYSTMNSSYDFTEDSPVAGTNHRLSSQMDLWLYSAIVSTNFSVLNFYGGISYLDAVAETEMLGRYDIVDQDSGELIISLQNPLSLSHDVTGIKANLGVSLRLGLLKISAEYNFQEYETISAGFHIGM